MNVDEWQRRLEEHFTVEGVVGGQLLKLFEIEKSFGNYISEKYHGYAVLADSFFGFFLDTLCLGENEGRTPGADVDPVFFGILLDYASAFRSFRAAELLLTNGYPLSGYALLRDLKDFAVLIAGIIGGITTYKKVYGAEGLDRPIEEKDMPQLRANRKKEERLVFNAILGKKSGLKEESRRTLEHWNDLFHLEVHGRRLTSVAGVDWVEGKAPLPAFPRFHETDIAMYLNRSHEISWLLLRTLPFLQLSRSAFGADWPNKWHILDDSFRIEHQSRAEMGKEIASAIIELADRKFLFSPEGTCFHL